MAVGLETLVLVYTSLFILASPMTWTGGVGAKDDPEDRIRNALVTILKRDSPGSSRGCQHEILNTMGKIDRVYLETDLQL